MPNQPVEVRRGVLCYVVGADVPGEIARAVVDLLDAARAPRSSSTSSTWRPRWRSWPARPPTSRWSPRCSPTPASARGSTPSSLRACRRDVRRHRRASAASATPAAIRRGGRPARRRNRGRPGGARARRRSRPRSTPPPRPRWQRMRGGATPVLLVSRRSGEPRSPTTSAPLFLVYLILIFARIVISFDPADALQPGAARGRRLHHRGRRPLPQPVPPRHPADRAALDLSPIIAIFLLYIVEALVVGLIEP